VNAAIKAEVSGYLLSQNYVEGAFVRKGQLLFEIDPRPLDAALAQANGDLARARGQLAQARAQLLQAQAQLAQAVANQGRTQLDVDRYTPLRQGAGDHATGSRQRRAEHVASKAQVEASKAGIETARAQIEAGDAAVESAQAAVDAAKVNTGFTHLVSPIDGIAGQAQVAGRQSGQPEQWNHHHGFHGGPDPSELHRRRAGVSEPRQEWLADEPVAARPDTRRRQRLSAKG